MRAVLGIDAAWTVTQPSGVAGGGARRGQTVGALLRPRTLIGAFTLWRTESSPKRNARWARHPMRPSYLLLLRRFAANRLTLLLLTCPWRFHPLLGVAFPMTLFLGPTGARKCGTHTPSARRPGGISDALRQSFELAGYPLCTDTIASPGLIEVYPHPALVELAGAAKRLPYKASSVRSYWPAGHSSFPAWRVPTSIDNGTRL